MIVGILAAVAAGASAPGGVALQEAANAIAAGRRDQARAMIGRELATGARGQTIDELLAELAFADRRDSEALARFEALIARDGSRALYLDRAAVAALRVGDEERAERYARQASVLPAPSWRVWNVLGVVADRRQDWDAADRTYARALELQPARAELLNNLGWSYVLRGQWARGAGLLKEAARVEGRDIRIARNLELAEAALADDLPGRRPGEGDAELAARLNDAGVVARQAGQKTRATAAFARAIEVRGVWYERAWNNLQLAEGGSR